MCCRQRWAFSARNLRVELTTLAIVNVPWQIKQKSRFGSEFGTRFQKEVPLFLEIPKFEVYDKPRVASVTKINSIHSAVSMKHWLCDSTPDRGVYHAVHIRAIAYASRGKKIKIM